jgi:hypothetical protein
MRKISYRLATTAAGAALALAATGLAAAPAAATAAPDGQDKNVTIAAQAFRFGGFYPDYDTCYWTGFDGWNEGHWSLWYCTHYGLGVYALWVA